MNLSDIEERISKAAKKWERKRTEITLISVSKKQPRLRIQDALDQGLRCFGENRVQEAEARWISSGLKSAYPDMRLHMIGSLQTNKIKKIVEIFDMIHSVARTCEIEELAKEMSKQNKALPCLVQVNTGDESQKSGIAPGELGALLHCAALNNVKIQGLMCLPPVNEPAGLHFAFLKTLADKHNLKDLSMGMSNDFETAIAAGATFLRIGSAVFGERSS